MNKNKHFSDHYILFLFIQFYFVKSQNVQTIIQEMVRNIKHVFMNLSSILNFNTLT